MSNTYARPSIIIRLKPLNEAQLRAAAAHNGRHVEVPHTNDAGTARVLYQRAPTVMQGIEEIVAEHGAKRWSRGTNCALEAIITYPPNVKNPPPKDRFYDTGMEFLADVFPGCVVQVDAHDDEATPHMHAIVVPICDAPQRGRPRKGQPKKVQKCVSFHRFLRTHERRPGRRLPGDPPRNLYLAALHDRAAAAFASLGFKRGLPSARKHLGMLRIHGAHDAIIAVYNRAVDELPDVADGLLGEAAKALKEGQPIEKIGAQLTDKMARLFEVLGYPLLEIAMRGISYEVERRSRQEQELIAARLELENRALRAKLSALGVAPIAPVEVPPAPAAEPVLHGPLPMPITLKQALAVHHKPTPILKPLPTPETGGNASMQGPSPA